METVIVSDLSWTDDNGETWHIYQVRYEFDGSHWEIDLPATSWEDAEQRLSAIVNDGIGNRLTMAKLEESSPVEDMEEIIPLEWMSVYPPGYC